MNCLMNSSGALCIQKRKLMIATPGRNCEIVRNKRISALVLSWITSDRCSTITWNRHYANISQTSEQIDGIKWGQVCSIGLNGQSRDQCPCYAYYVWFRISAHIFQLNHEGVEFVFKIHRLHDSNVLNFCTAWKKYHL